MGWGGRVAVRLAASAGALWRGSVVDGRLAARLNDSKGELADAGTFKFVRALGAGDAHKLSTGRLGGCFLSMDATRAARVASVKAQ